nr:ABC transporter permease [uncultured Cohaesibacter sp.]
MLRFFSYRFIRALVTVFLVLVMAFLTLRFSGTPFEQMYPDDLTPEMEAALMQKYGLDRPLLEQFVTYLDQASHGEFGRSLKNREKVVSLYLQKLPYTLLIGGLALVLAIAVGIPLGAYSALYRTRFSSRAGMTFAFLGYAMPHFVIGIGLVLLFGYYWRLLPTTGMSTPYHLILPVITLAIPMIAGLSRFMRAAMLDAVSHSHVLTAASKGMTDQRLVRSHILRNALLPLITVIGLEVTGLINGSIFVESVFSLPGIGRIFTSAVEQRDFPVLQFGVIAYAMIVVIVNLLTDVSYVIIDPRVRLEKD